MRRATIVALVVLVAVAAFVAVLGLGGSTYAAKDFTVTCSTTATAVASADGFGYSAVWCDNNSATSVFIGGGDVDTSGLCISTTAGNCPRRDFPVALDMGAGALYCRVASGSQAINCLAGK